MARYLEDGTYWKKGALDRYGNPTWDGPYTVKTRWEEISEIFVTNDGKTDSSRARVYLDADLDIGDYIIRGKNTDSTPPNLAEEIKQFQEVRNVKGDKRERKLIL